MDNIEQIKSRFDIIETAVNMALKKARQQVEEGNESLARDPINWGDLKCQSVEFVIGKDYEHYRVVIDEAAPECYALCKFVIDELAADGIKDVGEVTTEW